MKHHNQNYVPLIESKPSKVQDVIVTIACLAVFALWGALLALGI